MAAKKKTKKRVAKSPKPPILRPDGTTEQPRQFVPPGKRRGGKPRGRKPHYIDWDKVAAMAKIQCSPKEIAGVLEIHKDTLENRALADHGIPLKEYMEQHGAKGKMSLRRRQYVLAQRGNATMLVWLGKNWLGQTDKMESKNEVTVTQDLSKLTTEELESLKALQEKLDG